MDSVLFEKGKVLSDEIDKITTILDGWDNIENVDFPIVIKGICIHHSFPKGLFKHTLESRRMDLGREFREL